MTEFPMKCEVVVIGAGVAGIMINANTGDNAIALWSLCFATGLVLMETCA